MENSCLITLIEKFRKQDMSVFAVIFSEFEKLIYYYSHRGDKEEVFQELTVFLVELLYKLNLSEFKRDRTDTLKRYIAVSIRNRYLSEMRKGSKISREYVLMDEYTGSLCDLLTAEILKEALSTLSEKQQKVIVYKYIYGYSDAEIGNVLNISRQSVNSLKNRAIERLREYYEYGI